MDARLTTRAIRQPVRSMDNLLQAADELAYQKGAAVLGMFEAWIGPEVFRKGIRDYLAAHAWGNATAADLWSALSKASGKDVGKPMATFLDQPGVPLVSATLVDDGKSVRLARNDGSCLAGVSAAATPSGRSRSSVKYSESGSRPHEDVPPDVGLRGLQARWEPDRGLDSSQRRGSAATTAGAWPGSC